MDNKLRIKANQKQQSKVSWKRKEALKMADAVYNFCLDNGIELPNDKRVYNSMVKQMQDNSENTDLHDYLHEAIKMYYIIKNTCFAVYQSFESHGVKKLMLDMMFYTKHKMDPVWLFRKSQLIRKMYLNYLETAVIDAANLDNRKLIEHLQPYHLTLTVPHAGGLYEGKQFYAKQLNKAFHDMRKLPKWKQYVHGGEYGIEVKPNKQNGLHIHIHSLCFLREGVCEIMFNKWLKKTWERITGGKQIHFEKLFVYTKNYEDGCICEPWYTMQNGRKVRKLVSVVNDAGEVVQVQAFRYKKYITPRSDISEYMKGVMECIKYHFKTDSITDDNGNYDVPLMCNILNDSTGLRFYSRFGAFYKEKALNITYKKDAETIEDNFEDLDETENEIMGNASTVVETCINPFTFEIATANDYELVVGKPETLIYSGAKSLNPYEIVNYSDHLFVQIGDKNASISDIIKLVVNHKLHTVLMPKREPRKNRQHSGQYELDWYCAEPHLVFESLEN